MRSSAGPGCRSPARAGLRPRTPENNDSHTNTINDNHTTTLTTTTTTTTTTTSSVRDTQPPSQYEAILRPSCRTALPAMSLFSRLVAYC